MLIQMRLFSAQHRQKKKRYETSDARPGGRISPGPSDQAAAMVLILPRAFFTAGMLMMIRVMTPSARMKE